jgi:flagellar hook-basal body complex protein FliE
MTVVSLHPDRAMPQVLPPAGDSGASSDFGRALDGIGALLDRAERSEDAFARHRGSLVDAVYERSRADVMLAVTTAALQRTAQSLQSIVNMQV